MLNDKEKYFNRLSKYESFDICKYYIQENKIEDAYKIANQTGNQMTRDLTMYLLTEYKENELFKYNLFGYLDYIPENFLYEVIYKDLVVYCPYKEIGANAFAFCEIKELIISKNIEVIGDNALSLNEGKITYEGTKEEFIGKFLGKSKLFKRSNKDQQIFCSDGVINFVLD